MSEQWHEEFYPSGTTVVTSREKGKPHLYVYGPFVPGDEDKCDQNRYAMCKQLRDFLNGGERPKWLDDLQRMTEVYAEDLDGTSIRATGPSIDQDPPRCNWKEDDSPEAHDERARLMDRLFLGSNHA